MKVFRAAVMVCFIVSGLCLEAQSYPAPTPGDFMVKDFQFKSGEKLPEVKLHYYTLGTPQKDASGKVTSTSGQVPNSSVVFNSPG